MKLIRMSCSWNHFTVSEVQAFGVTGPRFFEDENGNAVIVTADPYLCIVNEFLFSELRRHNTSLGMILL